MEVVNPPLIRLYPRLQRAEPAIIDSSAAQAFKRCPRQYFYRYVLARSPKGDPPYFRFGSAYHKFRQVLETSGKFTTALTAAQELFKARGGDPVAGSKYDYMTELRLLKSCQVAYEKWKHEKLQKVIEVLAVEQPFNVELSDGTHTSGRFDQVIRWNGKLWGRDFKTSSKMGQFYERTLEPNDQFSRYTFAQWKLSGEHINGQVIEVLYNTKREGPQILQFLATRTESQLKQWEQDQILWNAYLKVCRDNDNWPMNENSCYNCMYHAVCKTPTENMQMNRLENDYKYDPWDNTKTEGDE